MGVTGEKQLNLSQLLHVFSLLILASCAGAASKSDLDDEVRRLCGIDGGVKIYETVRLPPEKLNQWGQPNFYLPTEGQNALGAEYTFHRERKYLREGNPSLRRSHYSIVRRSDNKLLGESISYSRGGGDAPGPWQPSSYSCPEIAGDIPLLTKVFLAQ